MPSSKSEQNPDDETASQPNIVLIHWHDLGKHLGAYGVASVETPCVDRLAAEGIRMDRAFSTAPLCSPSRGSLFTGRYPHSNGLMGLSHLGWEYHSNEHTLPMLLGRRGYRTVLVGLQHESSYPDTLGFDEIHNLSATHQYAAPVAELASQIIRAHSRDATPLFISVGMFEPHRPFAPHLYPVSSTEKPEVPSYLPDTLDVRQEIREFEGAIRYADDATGRVLQALEETGLDANTIVVFTTDHGIPFPGAKSTLRDPGTEVALIVRVSTGVAEVQRAAGSRTDQLVSNVDVVPTLLDLIGAPIPASVQGESFAPWLRGAENVGREMVFSEKNWHDENQYDPVRAVRTRDFKYIRSWAHNSRIPLPGDMCDSAAVKHLGPAAHSPRDTTELYDLIEDPGEGNNLAGDPGFSHVESRLASELAGFMQSTNDPLLDGPIAAPRSRGSDIGPMFGSETPVQLEGTTS